MDAESLAGLPSPGGRGEAGERGSGVRVRAGGPPFAKLPGMDEIRPEKAPGPTPETEVKAAAQSGEPPRWGKGTEHAEDGKFLEGPHSRASELRRLLRIGADFIRGFRGLHFVGPCVTVFGSARFHGGPSLLRPRPRDGAAARPRRLHRADRRRPRHHGGGQPRRPRRRRAVDRLQHRPAHRAEAQPLPRPLARVPLLLRPQGDAGQVLLRLRGAARRVRHHGRDLRVRDADPDREDQELPPDPDGDRVLAAAARFPLSWHGARRRRSCPPTATGSCSPIRSTRPWSAF